MTAATNLPVICSMRDDTLSPGQRALLEALVRLDELDLGDAEPAATFRPAHWAGGPPPGIDLAAIAGRPAATAPPRADPGTGAEVPTRAEEAAVPPPCPGIAEIIASVNAGDASAAVYLEQSLRRIEAFDGRINAFVTLSRERAREEARRVDEVVAAGERPRPLAGVPLAHKDILATAGIRTTAGSELLRHYVPVSDATVVGRLSNAGTLLVGKTNTHEFATGTTGTVSCFGAARNPWAPECLAGGSSSGSAAALAAGLVSAATGTDTGGSIRIPAACCGIVGLKPTYGRVSRTGVIPFAWSLDHVGPMGRRVADVASLLTAMAGHDPFDRASAELPGGDFSATLREGVRGLRFALPEPGFLALATTPVANAVREAADLLAELGAQRVEVEMPTDISSVGPAAIALFLAEGGAVHRRTLVSHPGKYAGETRAFLGLSERVGAHAYLQAQRLRARLADGLGKVFQSVDILLTPTLPMTAPNLDAREVEGVDGPLDVRAAMTLFTRPFNLTGLPALSLPCGFAGGLPIGLQVVGRPFEESTVLRVAHAYEDAAGWHRQRPPGFA